MDSLIVMVNHPAKEILLYPNDQNTMKKIRESLSVILPDSSLKILSTLISCLPSESKELLHKNGIFISTPTSKPPLFNYASFFKVLSIEKIDEIIISNL